MKCMKRNHLIILVLGIYALAFPGEITVKCFSGKEIHEIQNGYVFFWGDSLLPTIVKLRNPYLSSNMPFHAVFRKLEQYAFIPNELYFSEINDAQKPSFNIGPNTLKIISLNRATEYNEHTLAEDKIKFEFGDSPFLDSLFVILSDKCKPLTSIKKIKYRPNSYVVLKFQEFIAKPDIKVAFIDIKSKVKPIIATASWDSEFLGYKIEKTVSFSPYKLKLASGLSNSCENEKKIFYLKDMFIVNNVSNFVNHDGNITYSIFSNTGEVIDSKSFNSVDSTYKYRMEEKKLNRGQYYKMVIEYSRAKIDTNTANIEVVPVCGDSMKFQIYNNLPVGLKLLTVRQTEGKQKLFYNSEDSIVVVYKKAVDPDPEEDSLKYSINVVSKNNKRNLLVKNGYYKLSNKKGEIPFSFQVEKQWPDSRYDINIIVTDNYGGQTNVVSSSSFNVLNDILNYYKITRIDNMVFLNYSSSKSGYSYHACSNYLMPGFIKYIYGHKNNYQMRHQLNINYSGNETGFGYDFQIYKTYTKYDSTNNSFLKRGIGVPISTSFLGRSKGVKDDVISKIGMACFWDRDTNYFTNEFNVSLGLLWKENIYSINKKPFGPFIALRYLTSISSSFWDYSSFFDPQKIVFFAGAEFAKGDGNTKYYYSFGLGYSLQ